MRNRGQSSLRPSARVLIVLGQTGMGDAVEALPVFEMIFEAWRDVYIGAGYFRDTQQEILETSRHVSQTVRLFGGVRYARRSLKGFLRNFGAIQGFDTVLFLYKKDDITWPMLLAARLAGARALYAHGYRYRNRCRSTYSDFPEHVFFQIVASNLLLGSPLIRVRKPEIILSQQDRLFAEEFFRRNRLGRRPVVIINTQSSGTGSLPDWGIHKYVQVANGLVDRGAEAIFNGGGERQIEEFRGVSGQLRNGVVLLERPSPRQLAAIFGSCDLYVGAGHGAACLAMAVGTPTVTLVGPGEHGYPGQERIGPVWWPRGPGHTVISKIHCCRLNRACNSCHPEPPHLLKSVAKRFGLWEPFRQVRKRMRSVLRRPPRLPGSSLYPPCLEAITVEEVLQEAVEHLNRSNAGPGRI